jgi:hypothetical protein
MQSRTRKALCWIAAGLLLAGASGLQRSLVRQRSVPPLSITPISPLEDAPPVLAFSTMALGSFRGLIANALWVRANDLQQEGKYFEMVQLADWITKLEPTLTEVWVVQAWNMAYNISVKFTEPADRWRWVKSGIELLRDHGLRYNPNEALMYRELGWFFQHKMGQNLDDAHHFYKFTWAREMTEVLGGGRPDFAALLNPQTAEARQRVQTLRETYKMDPLRMKEVDDTYGPMDWRLPEAHAIYWAALGLKYSRPEDLITLRRVIYQSMAMAVLRGRIVYVDKDRLHTGPDLSRVERANAAYEQMIREDTEKPHAIKNAHKSWVRELVNLLYIYGRNAEAKKWFAFLKSNYPDAVPADVTSAEEFAFKRIQENLPLMTHDRAKAVVEGLITQHFFNLAVDEDDRAEGMDRMARHVWQEYDRRSAARRNVLQFLPYEQMKKNVLDRLLDEQSGLIPELNARLRTKLGLPPAPTSATVAPKTGP